jgi:cytochrome P450
MTDQARLQPQPIDNAEFERDPHAVLAKHREMGWWAPIGTTPWSEVLAYDRVRELLASDDHMAACLDEFLQQLMLANPRLTPEHVEISRALGRQSLINLDGERHHRLRSLVSRAFTPRSVAALRPLLEARAASLAAELETGADFMRGFARALPAFALCELTGIPAEDRDRFVAWIDVLEVQLKPQALLALDRAGSERVVRAYRELTAYTVALVAARRQHPREDLLSRLVREAEGEFDDATIAGLVADLIFAGNDTTRNELGLMVLRLAEHPDAWERVYAEPQYASAVIEEVLRLDSTAPGPVRKACPAFTYQGRDFPEGEVSVLSIWSANRDESFWGDDAHRFDPDRDNAGQHMSFGHGPHYCLGASLAREELRAALIALTGAVTALRVVEPPPMHPPGSIYGPISLKLDFRRREAASP